MAKEEPMPDLSGIEGKACWDRTIFSNSNSIHQNLVCGIGMGVMETPVRTPCDHLFCSFCIHQWLAYNKTCPVCRQSLDPVSMKRDRNIEGIINDLAVCCTEHKEGCPWTGRLEDLDTQHLCTCQHVLVDCPVDGCPEKLARRSLRDHKQTCEYRSVVCEPCGQSMKQKELDDHIQRCSHAQIRAQECTCNIQ
mmetsp:Transcript_5127/g.10506  ORF Transcript_5127/g.10506 Transcript_5127/m.10506 type:complete len:193 (-) Transcript_5127:8-586(-)